MGLFRWIKNLFAPPKRDISRLANPDASLDAVEEKIDLSGKPLKEKHRRLALRDRRLLPKARSLTRELGIGKRKNVMTVREAERLFAGTLRTRNRRLRDLKTDHEQLERYGLPGWESEDDVARALGISTRELWFFSVHREREAQPHYVTFAIPKRSGGKRLIMAPKRRLKAIQRKLLELLVEKLPVSEYAHAFRKERNVRSGAEAHVGQRLVMRLDLKDFFPTVTFARVRGLLIAYGYSYPVASTLAVVMTEAERQPVSVDEKVFHVPVGLRHCVQGAPTSPGLCNAMLLRMDRRLAGLAKKYNCAYTRYADDLTFSGDLSRGPAHRLRSLTTRIVEAEGFVVNRDKTRVMTQGGRQTVTNVVVNKMLGLSRQERRRMRACAHRLRQAGSAAVPEHLAELRGRIAYLQMLNPQQAAAINARLEG